MDINSNTACFRSKVGSVQRFPTCMIADQSSFSLPASLVDSPPAKQKIMYRLVYRLLPSQPPPSSPSPSSASVPLPLAPSHFMSLDIVFAEPKLSSMSEDELTLEEDTPIPLSTTCAQGTDVCLDIMMPDRSAIMCLILSMTLTSYTLVLGRWTYASPLPGRSRWKQPSNHWFSAIMHRSCRNSKHLPVNA